MRARWYSVLSFVACSPAAPSAKEAPPFVIAADAGAPVLAAAAPVDAATPEPVDTSAPEPVDTSAASAAAGPPAPRRPAIAMPGACVDPTADATKRSPQHFGPVMDPVRVDLDDDGEDDWIVTMDADATAYRGYMYIARGACAHWVGSWEGAGPHPNESATRGLRDLESWSPCPTLCCASETVKTLKFDGKVYRTASVRKVKRDCSETMP